jgi:hypothetical protein
MNMKPPNRRAQAPGSRVGYGIVSCLVFVLTMLVWLVVFTRYDSIFLGLSPATERWLVFATLLLPAVAGIMLGAVGLRQPQQRKAWALTGLLLNSVIALFFTLIPLFAG